MQTFLFFFDSFGFISWIFVLGCVFAGAAFAHSMWAFREAQIVQLRREQARLRQEIALRDKSIAHRQLSSGAPREPAPAISRELSPPPAPSQETRLPKSPSSSEIRNRPLRSVLPETAPSASLSSTARAARRSTLREDRQLGLVFYAAPDESDPLDRLPSITPSQVRDLNMLGIYKFEQIARWNETQVRSFATLLGMEPGELEQREWVRHAKTLHGVTHGSKMVLAS